MELKKTLNEYTEAEFLRLINEISEAKGTDKYQDDLLDNFIAVTEHPAGSDLIYYPDIPANLENLEEHSAETILKIVKEWRKSQGLPGFKE
ncbi:bacteriocin immunity protein [Vibrio sp. WXL103]|uniref:bacteriocin immunity protein n=1 Tax=Vibrio sp. WXL103 TaxID=3450710 RepID=UPI003EC5B687